MIEQLKELENTFLEEYESTEILLGHKKSKSVTILLSKALFALIDYLIYKKYHKLPKNHINRFRILQEKEEKIYSIVDNVWNKYTDTYNKPALQESINELSKAIKKIVEENEEFSPKIKKIVK